MTKEEKKKLKELKQEYIIKVRRQDTTLDFDEWLEYKKQEKTNE